MQLPRGPHLSNLAALSRAIYAFEALLKEVGLSVPPGSPLEAAALGIEEMNAVHQGHMKHRHREDYRPRWRQALGLADLAERLLEVRSHPDFLKMRGHLDLLVSDKEVTQYAQTAHGNSHNDKVFELWASAALLRMMTDCSIDDPHHSLGDNPDFIGTWRRKRWGVAFKAPHSEHPETLIKNIRGGVRQINNSSVEAGIVLLSGKNIFPHDDAWPAYRNEALEFVYGALPDVTQLETMMHAAAKHCNGLMCYHAAGDNVGDPPTKEDLELGRRVFWSSLKHKKPEQFVLTLWPMIVGSTVPGTNVQALSIVKKITGFEGDYVSEDARALARSFNLALHGRDPFGPEPNFGE